MRLFDYYFLFEYRIVFNILSSILKKNLIIETNIFIFINKQSIHVIMIIVN